MKSKVTLFVLTALLSQLTLAELPSLSVDEQKAAKLSCYLITSWTIFDLRPLQNTVQDYKQGNLTWNYC